MTAHQRRLSRSERRRREARERDWLKQARRRDIDQDMPHYLERDLGRLDSDLRVDEMPAVVRARGMG